MRLLALELNKLSFLSLYYNPNLKLRLNLLQLEQLNSIVCDASWYIKDSLAI